MLYYSKIGFDAPKGALDFSFMSDAPAGKHGFLKTKDGHFVFEDGTPIRFFGVNLAFDGAICDKENAPKIVDDLWRSGCNIVRLHHVDGNDREFSLINYTMGDSQHYSEEGFDRLDYFVSLLREKGIYLHLDMFTIRNFLPGDGFVDEDFAGMSSLRKGMQFYDEKIIELHKKFIRYYLTHVNPYTGLSYIDDPAVAIIQYVNENSITWVPELTDKENRPSKLLDMKFNAWLAEKYRSREALDAAWTNEMGVKGLSADEDPFLGTVRRPQIGCWGERKFWAGDDYSSVSSPARASDLNKFYIETERSTFNMIYGFMRSLGVKCCINCSNLPFGPVDLLCNTDGDLTENNAYWNHPVGGFEPPVQFHDFDMCAVDPRVDYNVPFSEHMVFKCAYGRAKNKPFVITEWNAVYSTRFRVDAILQMAAYGALQDWDGIILFSYTHSSGEKALHRESMTEYFDSCVDPAIWGFFGIASMIFRNRLVDVAKNTLDVVFTENDVVNSTPGFSELFKATTFVSKTQAAFINDKYYGDADVAISSGNTATGDYTSARHALIHTTSPYRDGMQKNSCSAEWLAANTPKDAVKVDIPNVDFETRISDRALVADVPKFHTVFGGKLAEALDYSMKYWGLISDKEGWSDGSVVSDTSQLSLNFGKGNFTVDADMISVFAGRTDSVSPEGNCGYEHYGCSGDVKLFVENEKAGVAVLSLDGAPIPKSKKILVRAMGECMNTDMKWDGNTMYDIGHAPIIYDDIRGILELPVIGDSDNICVEALHDLGAVAEGASFNVLNGKLNIKIGGYSAYLITR